MCLTALQSRVDGFSVMVKVFFPARILKMTTCGGLSENMG